MKWNSHNIMTVIPVAFNVDHEEKLGHAKMILEDGFLATNPEFHKLTTALRTTVAEEKSLFE
jgi:hypothetical protein